MNSNEIALICKVLDGVSATELHSLTGAPLDECEKVAKLIADCGLTN